MARAYDYFGIKRGWSIFLAFFPLTACVCGVITRFNEGNVFSGLLRLVFGWNIVWFLDFILMITYQRILRLINV